MRAVLDPNVIISSALSRVGAPALVVAAWLDGAFEFVASPLLVAELRRALRYPKLRSRISITDAAALVDLIGTTASMVDDPSTAAAVSSSDPGDDYLIALAGHVRSMLVSGDQHLLALSPRIPVSSPREFLDMLELTHPGETLD